MEVCGVRRHPQVDECVKERRFSQAALLCTLLWEHEPSTSGHAPWEGCIKGVNRLSIIGSDEDAAGGPPCPLYHSCVIRAVPARVLVCVSQVHCIQGAEFEA